MLDGVFKNIMDNLNFRLYLKEYYEMLIKMGMGIL